MAGMTDATLWTPSCACQGGPRDGDHEPSCPVVQPTPEPGRHSFERLTGLWKGKGQNTVTITDTGCDLNGMVISRAHAEHLVRSYRRIFALEGPDNVSYRHERGA